MFIKRNRKDKIVKEVDRESFNSAISEVDKLRPLRDRVVKLIKNIEGFSGVFISKSILHIMVLGNKSRAAIDAALNSSMIDGALIDIIDCKDMNNSGKRGLGFNRKPVVKA